ncbi:Glycylpeptide N-tetradecanoyltransferase 2 [Chamberlinius hualienensis]
MADDRECEEDSVDVINKLKRITINDEKKSNVTKSEKDLKKDGGGKSKEKNATAESGVEVVSLPEDKKKTDGDDVETANNVHDEKRDQPGVRNKSKKKKDKEKDKDSSENIEDEAKNIGIPLTKIPDLQKAFDLVNAQLGSSKSVEGVLKKQFQFWDTQPVPKMSEEIKTNEPIELDTPLDKLRQEPYTLPGGFVWDTLDISVASVLKELYQLLNENYVEDDDNMFRFDYSPEFLQWALKPPGWLLQWHVGVRVSKSGKLVGFISAVPAKIRVYDKTTTMVEINFLCVHKKLRSKRVAPVLIREITRRVNLQGIFQAVYTAGVVLPKPVGSCRYWHRSLNPRKLIDVKFSHLSNKMTMQRTIKLYKLPETTKVEGFRRLASKDLPSVHVLLGEYLKKFALAPVLSLEELTHWISPREGIIDSYVVEKDGALTDLVSFYTLPSTVMHHAVHKSLKAAYSFYNVSTTTTWTDLMGDALIVAKNAGFDVFNALDLMENKEFLQKLKFGIGDGNLQYYLYNWRCPAMDPEKIGLVLQ